ncbi:monocarboxylate transporter 9-like isoform X2 [Corythoichthys intestinalis]|uniref:monocarboxylate transporter 9-like isoform X2 n=1 Tax=Corythoichthys intestinalis TaxID=161448 RepID=UPI0025A60A84|nr:monocarboxylate transporter 9-like isoform X2 [Corythoichthys intestinalis]
MTSKALDGGWGWAIVVASFLAQLLAYGSPQSVGVLYPEWLHTFQEGKGMTAWVGSLVAGVGLIASLGCGLVYAATLTITCQYFDKRRGLALGIVTTGTSVGTFIFATAQNELIMLYGLDGCLLIIGALALNLMACAGFMRPLYMPGYYLKQKAALERNTDQQLFEKPQLDNLKMASGSAASAQEKTLMVKELLITIDGMDASIQVEKKRRSFLARLGIMKVIKKKKQAYSKYMTSIHEILQDQAMVAFCIGVFLFSLGAFPPVLLIEDVAQSQGLIEEVSVIPLVSIGAIAACVGKLVLGILVDIRWIKSIYLYAFTMFAGGVVLLLIPVTKSYVGLQILSAILGFFSGNWSITSYITTKIVGLDRLTQAHGIVMFFGGFGIMLGPPVVGWFFDWTQSYDLAFYFSGSCVLLGALVLSLLTLPCCNRKPASENDKQYTSNCDKVASVA